MHRSPSISFLEIKEIQIRTEERNLLISPGQHVQPNRSDMPKSGKWFRIFRHRLHFGGQRRHIFGLFGHDLQFDYDFFTFESFAFTQTCDYTIRHFIGSVGFYVQYLYFANHGNTLLFNVSIFILIIFSENSYFSVQMCDISAYQTKKRNFTVVEKT